MAVLVVSDGVRGGVECGERSGAVGRGLGVWCGRPCDTKGLVLMKMVQVVLRIEQGAGARSEQRMELLTGERIIRRQLLERGRLDVRVASTSSFRVVMITMEKVSLDVRARVCALALSSRSQRELGASKEKLTGYLGPSLRPQPPFPRAQGPLTGSGGQQWKGSGQETNA